MQFRSRLSPCRMGFCDTVPQAREKSALPFGQILHQALNTYGVGSGRFQSEEPVPRRWSDNDLKFIPHHGWRVGHTCPSGRAEVEILLKVESGRGVWPGYHHCVRGRKHNAQTGCPRSLDGGNNSPKTALQSVVSATHQTCVRLADRSGNRVDAPGAGPASTVNRIPIDRVVLTLCRSHGRGQ